INTIIWVMIDTVTDNEAIRAVILTLSLVLAILVSASRIEAKAHKTSEVVFSACVGISIVLLIYGVTLGVMRI
ncbi:phosphatase PAP2 family protein, partial [Holdemanella sp.]|uniref:phosphatase PAP2 family protein n=1 Tax=Holdemanella sp. TaxID=1971762 RepID=UPI003AEFC7FD